MLDRSVETPPVIEMYVVALTNMTIKLVRYDRRRDESHKSVLQRRRQSVCRRPKPDAVSREVTTRKASPL